MVITKDDYYLFVADSGGYIRQFCINNREYLDMWLNFNEGRIYSICLSNDDSQLFTSDSRGFIKQWDIATQELIKTYKNSTDA